MFEEDAEKYANGKGHEHYNYLFEENAGSPATFANLFIGIVGKMLVGKRQIYLARFMHGSM